MESREGCARTGCYTCSGDCLSCNLLPCSLAPCTQPFPAPAKDGSEQKAAIMISERQEEFRIGKYPSKTAQRDISHLPPRRTGCSQRSEAPVQVTATSLPTHTLSLCGSCCSGEVNSTGPGAVPALPRQSFPQDSSKALHKDKDSKQAESCVGWNHPIAEEPGQRGK